MPIAEYMNLDEAIAVVQKKMVYGMSVTWQDALSQWLPELKRLRTEVKSLEKQTEWLIETQIVKSWNGKFVGALSKDESGYAVYPTKAEAVASWRKSARKAVEEGYDDAKISL